MQVQAKFTGETNLAKFGALEKTSAEELLKWESLSLQDLSVGYNPLFVRAKKVALADFFAHIIIQPNGRLNLQEITDSEATPKPATEVVPDTVTERLLVSTGGIIPFWVATMTRSRQTTPASQSAHPSSTSTSRMRFIASESISRPGVSDWPLWVCPMLRGAIGIRFWRQKLTAIATSSALWQRATAAGT